MVGFFDIVSTLLRAVHCGRIFKAKSQRAAKMQQSKTFERKVTSQSSGMVTLSVQTQIHIQSFFQGQPWWWINKRSNLQETACHNGMYGNDPNPQPDGLRRIIEVL